MRRGGDVTGEEFSMCTAGETAWYLREQKACVCTCGSVFPGTCVRCTVGSETGQTDRIAL